VNIKILLGAIVQDGDMIELDVAGRRLAPHLGHRGRRHRRLQAKVR